MWNWKKTIMFSRKWWWKFLKHHLTRAANIWNVGTWMITMFLYQHHMKTSSTIHMCHYNLSSAHTLPMRVWCVCVCFELWTYIFVWKIDPSSITYANDTLLYKTVETLSKFTSAPNFLWPANFRFSSFN